MGVMSDKEIVEKSVQAKRLADSLNSLMRELAFEGVRVELDVAQASAIGWAQEVPMVNVEFYRRVAS